MADPQQNTNEIHRTLGRLEAKLDAVLDGQSSMRSEMAAIDVRVSSLETFKTKATSTIAAVAATAGGSLGITLRSWLGGG